LRYVWYFLFVAAIAVTAAGVVAQVIGRHDLLHMLGGLSIALCGSCFMAGVVLNVKDFGRAWVVGLGWITKHSHPFAYWAILGIPGLLGLALLVTGIWVLVRAL
jgi:hypothetical protein